MASWEINDSRAINAGDMGSAPGDVPSTDQRRKRSYAIYTDQHGRTWGAVIENKTGDPAGPLEPQFSAPLRPLDKYITINSNRRQVVIRYADIIRDIVTANEEWDTQLRSYARKSYGTKAPEAIANPPADLLDMVGPKPREMREPWEAAMQGNKWILGLSTAKPTWAKAYFPEEVVKPKNTFQMETTNRYPDADEAVEFEPEQMEVEGIAWKGPAGGWELPNGERIVRRKDLGETGEEHKARALAALAAMEG